MNSLSQKNIFKSNTQVDTKNSNRFRKSPSEKKVQDSKILFPPINDFRKQSITSNISQKNRMQSNSHRITNSVRLSQKNTKELPEINLQSRHSQSVVNGQINQSSQSNSENQKESKEKIQVCIRIRPLSDSEKNRGDKNCLKVLNNTQLLMIDKKHSRSYTFNLVLGVNSTQEDIFYKCSVNRLIDNAIKGYSVTIFAYGQTGSGKTYTIMGREDSINENILSNDKFSGIMPKSIKYLWKSIKNKQRNYYIKVSFLEIYNEQINDLLNPGNKNLQIRWDQSQGFFVEGLLVILCYKPEEVVDIILQGTKNRKKGSHDLNKDSSRSHTILTVYIISDGDKNEEGKKYGKISFVDLAGSERLNETHSKRGMLKETGNINKSLFTLGKVISTLASEKKPNQPAHVPYRDSKLTMLLMDSIGGKSKTLMIACVDASAMYAEETISTLNYAGRTMNIENKPIIQHEKISVNDKAVNLHFAKNKLSKSKNSIKDKLQINSNQIDKSDKESTTKQSNIITSEQNDFTKIENQFLKNEFVKLCGVIPNFNNGGFTAEEINNFQCQYGMYMNQQNNNNYQNENKLLNYELESIKNNQDIMEKNNKNLSDENKILNAKLSNLENLFIESDIMKTKNSSKDSPENYNLQSVIQENNELKKAINKLEMDNIELKANSSKNKIKNKFEDRSNEGYKEEEVEELKEQNNALTKKVEFLQKREMELIQTIMKLKLSKYDEVEEEEYE